MGWRAGGHRKTAWALAACLAAGAVIPEDGVAAIESRATPLPVGFTRESGYRLIKDWDFGATIRDEEALRREFHTRYIYANGALDHLNNEWSRYRDRENHVFTQNSLGLVARVPSGRRRRARSRAACCDHAGTVNTASSRSG